MPGLRRQNRRRPVGRQAFEIVRTWAAEQFPTSDLDVLRRYGSTETLAGVNAQVRSKADSLYFVGYGIQFPDGCAVEVPKGGGYGGRYRSFYIGGETAEEGRPDPNLAAVAAEAVAIREEAEARLNDFRAYLAGRPLRREIAERYPHLAYTMARRVAA